MLLRYVGNQKVFICAVFIIDVCHHLVVKLNIFHLDSCDILYVLTYYAYLVENCSFFSSRRGKL